MIHHSPLRLPTNTCTIDITSRNLRKNPGPGTQNLEFSSLTLSAFAENILKAYGLKRAIKYMGDYERTEYTNGDVKEIYYIAGGNGLTAMYIIENGIAHTYFVHEDYLGSILALSDEQGNISERYNFDALPVPNLFREDAG